MTKRVEKAKEKLITEAIKFARSEGINPRPYHLAAYELNLALTEARVQAERRLRSVKGAAE